jgi:hypothetical protein
MSIQAVSVWLIKWLLANSFESETAHHRVKEDLQEIHVISVLFLHDLDPLNCNRVLDSILLRSVNWELSNFFKWE